MSKQLFLSSVSQKGDRWNLQFVAGQSKAQAPEVEGSVVGLNPLPAESDSISE